MGKIRVAIIGVGNCASSLVQGVYYFIVMPVKMSSSRVLCIPDLVVIILEI